MRLGAKEAKPSALFSNPSSASHTHPIHPIHDSDKTSGTRILADLVKNEGFGAFFKGLTPKLVVIGPKLVFSFTVAQVRACVCACIQTNEADCSVATCATTKYFQSSLYQNLIKSTPCFPNKPRTTHNSNSWATSRASSEKRTRALPPE